VVTIDGGGSAKIIDQYRPDVAIFVVGNSHPGTNRVPGEMKVSWKWSSSLIDAPRLNDRKEYFQVLSQLNFYLKQHKAQHGFVLTDAELVPVKRLDENGHLAIASSIPWATGGPGNLTVLLGIWYLGMLAAEDNNWALNNIEDG
jgi:hypothetical protein